MVVLVGCASADAEDAVDTQPTTTQSLWVPAPAVVGTPATAPEGDREEAPPTVDAVPFAFGIHTPVLQLEPPVELVDGAADFDLGPSVSPALADVASNGAVLLVDEQPDGSPGTTLTITDAQLRIDHVVEFDSAPLVQDLGYPGVALVREFEPRRAHLVRAADAELVTIADESSPELVFFPRPVGPDRLGSRFVAVTEGVAGGRIFVLDLGDLELRPVPGTVRSGAPEISPDGRWVVVAADMGDRGAGAIELARPNSPDRSVLRYAASEGAIVEGWEFLADGSLAVTTRPPSATGRRTVHLIDAIGEPARPVLVWGTDFGARPVGWVHASLLVAEERSTGDHIVLDLSAERTIGRVSAPPTDPTIGPNGIGWFEDNSATLFSIADGSIVEFTSDAGPTPAVLDRSATDFFWVVDGFSQDALGLFRYDLTRATQTDFRDAVGALESGEHFFSFDPDRFGVDGSAVVGYDSEERAYVVRLGSDASVTSVALPDLQRIIDITIAPDGSTVLVLAGPRSQNARDSFLRVLDPSLAPVSVAGDLALLSGQKLAVWIAGSVESS